jgi:predicted GIY-YIG superfamily endonuclease
LNLNRYYIGSTKRLPEQRLIDHNYGKVKSTKSIKPLKLMIFKKFNTYSQARIIENRLKRLKRKDYIEKIVKDRYIKIS